MNTQEAGRSKLWPAVLVAAIVAVSIVLLSCGTPPPTINVAMLTYPNGNNACAQVSISDVNSSAQVFVTYDGTTPQLSAGGSTFLYNGPFTLSLGAPTMTSNTGTVNAIAVAAGYTPSGMISQPFNCSIPAPSFGVAGGGSCPVTVADINDPVPALSDSRFIYYEIGGNGDPSNLSTWSPWTRAFSVAGVTTTIFAVAAMGPNPQNLSPVASLPVNCGPPPMGQYDTVSIVMSTGADDAKASSEIWATMSGQPGTFCLKASDAAPPSAACAANSPKLDRSDDLGSYSPYWPAGSDDQNGLPNGNNQRIDGTNNRFVLSSPQASTAGFGTIDVRLIQHPAGSDSWDIQGITLTVSDSNNVLPPATLLRATPTNCLARLKSPPDATTVRFSLNGSAAPVYVDGNVAGETASCLNNGG